jgi:hypothetical protein
MAELHTEGLEYILGLIDFSDLEVGLATDVSLTEGATEGDITEVSGTGYTRQDVTSLTPAATGTNDRKLTTNEVTFTASGTWTGAKTMFCITKADGKLLASASLGSTYTLGNGDTLAGAMDIILTG